jgi:hypothetical protein
MVEIRIDCDDCGKRVEVQMSGADYATVEEAVKKLARERKIDFAAIPQGGFGCDLKRSEPDTLFNITAPPSDFGRFAAPPSVPVETSERAINIANAVLNDARGNIAELEQSIARHVEPLVEEIERLKMAVDDMTKPPGYAASHTRDVSRKRSAHGW